MPFQIVDRNPHSCAILWFFSMPGEGFSQHPRALVESSSIGDRTRISAFVHILPGARVGCDCTILDYTFIGNEVVVADRVTIHSGVELGDGIELEDDVSVGPNVAFGRDPKHGSRI